MIKIKIGFLLLPFLLAGCSSVDQPVASIPLVQNEVDVPSETVESELNKKLSVGADGSKIMLQGKSYVLGAGYFSAAGSFCRKLNGDTKNLLYCKNTENQWFAVDSTIFASMESLK